MSCAGNLDQTQCVNGSCGVPSAAAKPAGACCSACAHEAAKRAANNAVRVAHAPGTNNRGNFRYGSQMSQQPSKPTRPSQSGNYQQHAHVHPSESPAMASSTGAMHTTHSMRKSTGDVPSDLISFGRDAVKEGASIAREAIDANERRAEAEIAAKTASDAARAQAQQAAQAPLQVNPANQVQLGPPPTVPTQAPTLSTGEKVAIGGTIVTVIATAGGILLKVFGR